MTVRANARLAGFMFLFYIATGVTEIVLFNPISKVSGTAAKFAAMAQHPTLMRFGSVFALISMADALILGVALYALTRDYDRDLAILALMFRVAEGVVDLPAAFVGRARLAVATSDANTVNTLGPVLIKLQGFGALLGATAFAIGSTLFCYLFLRARLIPVSLSWIGLIGSAVLVIGLPLQLAGILTSPVTSLMWIPIAIFEVTVAFWLLIKGISV